MNKQLFFLLVGFLLGSTSLLLSQSFMPASPSKDGNLSFLQLQQSFDQWKKGKNLQHTTGWKWYKRWEDYWDQRLNADGTIPDISLFTIASKNVSQQKKIVPDNLFSSSVWLPVGPDSLPATYEPSLIRGMGRINCIAFHPTNSTVFWVGVAQGGVWKTTDAGNTWMPLTDDLPILRISDIAVDPIHPDTIYISVGDYAYLGVGLVEDGRKRNTHFGLGVWKTTNGGNTWNPTGLQLQLTDSSSSLTRRVFIHPSNTQELVAAGIYGISKSYDGGVNWTQKLDTMIWDIERDPSNPAILYASSAFIYNLQLGSAGIMKSTDFGETWVWLNTGIPLQNTVQRIEVAVSPANPNYVYAIACDIPRGFYALYHSTNAGNSWSVQSTAPNILEWGDGGNFGGQGTYDLVLLPHPTNPDIIYAGGINLWGSLDKGVTWDGISLYYNAYGPSIHADQHYLAYNPLSHSYYICNDGGLYKTDSLAIGSWNDAQNVPGYQWPTQWTNLGNGLQITYFYRLGLNPNYSGAVIAGAQDNSTFYYDVSDSKWYSLIGGDGMECMLDPTDNLKLYGSSQYGWLEKSGDGGMTFSSIAPNNAEPGEWTTPFIMHPTDPNTLFAGYGNVWESNDGGNNWTAISNFPIIPSYGDPQLISALAVAPSNPNYLYVAKRVMHQYNKMGEVWRTNDGGFSWQNVTAGLPDSLYFTYLTIQSDNPDIVWVTCSGFDNGRKVFKSTNGGNTWTNISYNLPNIPVNCVVQQAGDPVHPIYIGTDVGVYYIDDTTTTNSWQLYSMGLPNVIVSELEIHYPTGKIYAATFGRGIWSTDLYSTITSSDESNIFTNLQLSLYPNPTYDNYTLQVNGWHADKPLYVDIIDITGKRIYFQKLSPPGNSMNAHYAMPALKNSGHYYFRVSSGKYSKTCSLIVNK